MRAGPLSHQPTIERLNKDFVNAWILRRDLMALAADHKGELGAFAKKILAKYDYPVDSMVLDPDGNYLAHVAANSSGPDRTASYRKLLDSARVK